MLNYVSQRFLALTIIFLGTNLGLPCYNSGYSLAKFHQVAGVRDNFVATRRILSLTSQINAY